MSDLIIRDQVVFAGKYHLTGRLRSISLAINADAVDVSKLTDTTRSNAVGLLSITISVRGLYDTAFSPDADVFDLVNGGVAVPVTIGASGGAFGDVTYSASLLPSSYELPPAVGEAAEFSLEFASAGTPLRGQLLHPLTARTASGNGTASQLGAVGASQRVYLITHVIAISGGPTVSVKAQNSATSGGTFTDRVVRSGITSPGAFIDSAPGALADTWWRVAWTITGGTSPSVTFAAAVAII